jgi:Anti-sigma-K factor rskA, C-terminal
MPEREAEAFERHVMGCAEGRDEVERLRPAVAALPLSVQPLRAPGSLRESLLAQVRAEAAGGEPGETAAAVSGTRRRRVSERVRGTLRRARPAAAWASAAVLLVAGVVVGFAARSVVEPDAQSVAATVDQARLTNASGTLLISEDEDRAALSVHGLPTLPSDGRGEVYQLWLVRGEEVIPSSVFGVQENGSGTAAILEGIEDADAVLVTREPAGGSRAPSEAPVMRIDLS